MDKWRNRIVEQRMMPVADLKANPKNWRRHPLKQSKALLGAVNSVGIVQGVIFNRRTGLLVDGHLRVSLAVKHGEKEIPATIVDLSEDEENIVLATLDPIGAMAMADNDALLTIVETIDESILDVLDFLKSKDCKDSSFNLRDETTYSVIVDFDNSDDQAKLLSELESRNFICRLQVI